MAEKPKRPLSSFFVWFNENREAIRRENPDVKITEIAKIGGKLWKEIGDKDVSIL